MSIEPVFSQNILATIGMDNIYVLASLTIISILGWIFLIRFKSDYIKRHFVKGILSLVIFIPIILSSKIQTILVYSIVFFIPVILIALYDFLTLWSDIARKIFIKKMTDNEKPFDETAGVAGFALILTSLSVLIIAINFSIAFSQEKHTKEVLLFWKIESAQAKDTSLTFYDRELTIDFRIPNEHSSKFEENNCYSLAYYPSPFLEVDSGLSIFITEIAQITPCTISIEGN